MDVTNILNSINIISEKIFKSVEGEVFKTLDDIYIISNEVLKKEPLKNLFHSELNSNIILLLSSFIILFSIFYLIIYAVSLYNGNEQESIFKFIFRVGFCLLASLSSYYLCELVLSLNGILTEIISSIGKDLTGQEICFESLKEAILNLDEYMSEEFLSIDGMIKGVISFGATTILISFAIRYVTVIALILVAPVVIMLASSDLTQSIFLSWIKLFLTNIFMQNIVVVILIIPLAFKHYDSNMYKIVLIGSIYLLYKINNFSKEILDFRKVIKSK